MRRPIHSQRRLGDESIPDGGDASLKKILRLENSQGTFSRIFGGSGGTPKGVTQPQCLAHRQKYVLSCEFWGACEKPSYSLNSPM